MKALILGMVLVGCGPFAPNVVGRTCDAGRTTQHCASPTTYAACDTNIWREYPCEASCSEGGKCALGQARAETACAPAWHGVSVCKAPRLAMICVSGKWSPSTCAECPDGGFCFACTCV